jgi:hypothetical protein
MLRALPLAGFGIVLLPRKARLLPALIHSVNNVLPQPRVERRSAGFVWARGCCDVLSDVRSKNTDSRSEMGLTYNCVNAR